MQPVSEVDPRPLRLLERYASLSGAVLTDVGDHLLELNLPPHEARWFGGRTDVRIALTPTALDDDPTAEILANGSGLLQQVIDAIRDRGSLDDRGVVQPAEGSVSESPALGIPVHGIVAPQPVIQRSYLPVGRLLARLSVHAGPTIMERLVESDVVDLTSGRTVAPAIAAGCATYGDAPATVAMPAGDYPTVERLPIPKLIEALFNDLERQLAAELMDVRAESTRALTQELNRLDKYYSQLLEDIAPADSSDDAKSRRAAITADRDRRRADEAHRHAVRISVHPVQLVEWRVLAEQVVWSVASPAGKVAPFGASRFLAGQCDWQWSCPSCGAQPDTLRVCDDGHVGCGSCSDRCGMCGKDTCKEHGLATCAIDGQPACADHSSACRCCESVYCSVHSAHCDAADHDVCTRCAVSCGLCNAALCTMHAGRSAHSAPHGVRWLCTSCTVLCEGGANEPIGVDEAERCVSCERYVCATHATYCAIDGRLHCSSHLRRSDKSGRLLCEEHRAGCAEERHAVYGVDEVEACATCGLTTCADHHGVCTEDGRPHCLSHLAALTDQANSVACAVHREVCVVDGLAFSLGTTSLCPICTQAACPKHLRPCKNCGRRGCVRHVNADLCQICGKLALDANPSDEVLAAVADAARDFSVKGRRMAVDGTHTLVELTGSWGRRMIVAIRHGDTRAEIVMKHGLLGSERVR